MKNKSLVVALGLLVSAVSLSGTVSAEYYNEALSSKAKAVVIDAVDVSTATRSQTDWSNNGQWIINHPTHLGVVGDGSSGGTVKVEFSDVKDSFGNSLSSWSFDVYLYNNDTGNSTSVKTVSDWQGAQFKNLLNGDYKVYATNKSGKKVDCKATITWTGVWGQGWN
ncbi:hypothetical protein [Tumebacillus lipolyticus]|uniref:Uncharacterized protein n=1 Tax=Tumebacillus lipolyticus TaxID=1280370 RepID=A0ABW4ZS06_9BACL